MADEQRKRVADDASVVPATASKALKSDDEVEVPFQSINQMVGFLSGDAEYNFDLHKGIVNEEIATEVTVRREMLNAAMNRGQQASEDHRANHQEQAS
jgi:hypothetical protein